MPVGGFVAQSQTITGSHYSVQTGGCLYIATKEDVGECRWAHISVRVLHIYIPQRNVSNQLYNIV